MMVYKVEPNVLQRRCRDQPCQSASPPRGCLPRKTIHKDSQTSDCRDRAAGTTSLPGVERGKERGGLTQHTAHEPPLPPIARTHMHTHPPTHRERNRERERSSASRALIKGLPEHRRADGDQTKRCRVDPGACYDRVCPDRCAVTGVNDRCATTGCAMTGCVMTGAACPAHHRSVRCRQTRRPSPRYAPQPRST